jgi:ABC-type nickel/cobalt efflux system permease component RcnA
VDLVPRESIVTTPEGQAGLRTLRLETTYSAPLPDGWRDGASVTFTDASYEGRLGWREVVLRGGPGVEIASSDVPSVSVSDELRAYPEASLSSPLDVRAATAEFRPGTGAALANTEHPKSNDAVRGNPDGTLARFAELVAKDDLSIGVASLALLAAVGFGAIHGLSPGHGKTVVAAYLVGSRGTWKHALFLAAVVTATHTSTVYLLGFVALYFSDYVLAEDLYPWLGVASGGLIVLMGALLFAGRLRASGIAGDIANALRAWLPGAGRRALAGEQGSLTLAMPSPSHPHPHSHSHDGDHDHVHDGEHRHGFGPAHSHRVPGQDGEPVTFRSLLGLGVFAGMIPCPSAIVVMLSAIALHRVGFGLLLIVAFSLGLAGVLTAIGFALVFARRLPVLAATTGRLQAHAPGRLAMRLFPLAAALAVLAAGAVITMRAVAQL